MFVDYMKRCLEEKSFFPIDYWIVTTVDSSARSSGNHGTILSSTSFEQSPELRRITDVSTWYFRGAIWNAAFTVSLREKTNEKFFSSKKKKFLFEKDWLRLPKKAF